MPSDDLVINVRQISNYPFSANAGYGDAVLLQKGLGGPYYSMSAQGLVASALAVDSNRGLGVGAALPFGAGGNILAGQAFVSPLDRGLLFNCFASDGDPFEGAITYFAPGPAGALTFSDAGFAFMGAARGDNHLQPVRAWDVGMLVSRTGQVAVREQLTVGRPPIGPTEVVTLEYFTLHAIVRNPGNGKLNLTTEDILNAGGMSAVNAALAGYPTAEHPIPEAHGHEIATAGWVLQSVPAFVVGTWNGRKGDVCLGLWDIVYAGGAPIMNPSLSGIPRAPTADAGDSSTQIATTQFVTQAITAALAAQTHTAPKLPTPEFPL